VIGAEEARRWGVVKDATEETEERTERLDPRALLTRPREERARILEVQARTAAELYAPGSKLLEWIEEFAEDGVGESA